MRASTSWRKSSFSEGAGTDCVEVAWRKSSFSEGPQTDCVEVALAEGRAAVRDSKNATGPILTVPSAPWLRFVNAVSDGRPGRVS
ncbi:DUF397 domain-containing protein [Actinophytocola sp.]|uniref:DUF397 domain-containing protein n=1 Tax=Actinophytocola sp. TaxID=1872138 RepID=UPI002ED05D53